MIYRLTMGVVMTTILGCALGLAVAGADDDINQSRRQTDPPAADRQREQPAEPAAIVLQGKGRQASKKFQLEAGLCILEVGNDGDTNFIVRLLDASGKEVETLINQIGPFGGELGFYVKRPGQYLFDISANGNWTARLMQPRPEAGQPTPTTLSGRGYRATPFFRLDKGLVIFRMTSDGEGRFKATLMDRDGRTVAYLINALGQFEGSRPISIDNAGIYFLNVSGDGNWTIEVE
jgi:hypothetical protein